ncbi:lysine N(6)-hydroxylase/L-ornithine N(5)-oxygenase family protein [Pontibacillus salicampi]|uniref:L-lysine N6-monooxygenase MbtG n=1 Tax=Pontibacillus salicampi TaxID=1449801 RepID=A0ABV6LU50_9BACI
MAKEIYDFIGIGIGPFNLGLAALADQQQQVDGIFFDQTKELEWHPGMLIEGTDLQVPFLADLVSFADPTNPYTFMNYLHKTNRMYPFFFFQKLEVPRPEYNDYLKWVANHLDTLYFERRVVDVEEVDTNGMNYYRVSVEDVQTEETKEYYARHIVMSTGSVPTVFPGTEELSSRDIVHTSRYLYEKHRIVESNHVTVIGSGQSAAEIVADLLAEQEKDRDFHISWFTRSAGIFQLDTAKLPQEYFSPDYVDYFHSLTYEQRMNTLPKLDKLQNGVDPSTLSTIYDWLYHKSVAGKEANITIQPLTELKAIKEHREQYELTLHQWQADDTFTYPTEKVILATGYKPNIPDWFFRRFSNEVIWEGNEHYRIGKDCAIGFHDNRHHRIFTTTDIEHAHATGANNLGLSVNRNVKILNTIAGERLYPEGDNTIFQQFRMS